MVIDDYRGRNQNDEKLFSYVHGSDCGLQLLLLTTNKRVAQTQFLRFTRSMSMAPGIGAVATPASPPRAPAVRPDPSQTQHEDHVSTRSGGTHSSPVKSQG